MVGHRKVYRAGYHHKIHLRYEHSDHDKWTLYASTFFLCEKPGKWLKYRVFGTFSPLAKFIKISKRQPILPFSAN